MVVERTADFCRVRVLGQPEVRVAGCTEPFRSRADGVGQDASWGST